MLRKFVIYWPILFKPGDFDEDDWPESGVVCIPDTTVILASYFKTTRVFLPFPEIPRIDITQLQLARHKLAQHLRQKWDGNYKGRICSSTVVTESYGKLTASAVVDLEDEYQQFHEDRQLFMDLMSMFSDDSNVVHEETRQKKQVNVLLAAEAALILGTKLETVGCKLFSVFGSCKLKKARHLEKLHEESLRNKWNVNWFNTQAESAQQFTLAPAPEKDHMKLEIIKAVKMELNYLRTKILMPENYFNWQNFRYSIKRCNDKTTARSLCNTGFFPSTVLYCSLFCWQMVWELLVVTGSF